MCQWDVQPELNATLLRLRDFLVFALNRERKDAMVQRTKVSGCISLGFSIVPVIGYKRVLSCYATPDACEA